MKITREYLQGHQRLPRIGFGLIALWPRLQNLLGFCLFVTAFYFACRYGMSFSQACAAPFWFPDSVLLCALLLIQPRRWWPRQAIARSHPKSRKGTDRENQ